MSVADIPLSLYVHIPWCERKCPYCDFNSHQTKGAFDEALYVQCLLEDLDADIRYFDKSITDREIKTVFIGGGTPSLFSAQSFQTLLSGLQARLQFNEHAEITLEANPGSSEASKFAGFYEAGINRLSIGVQSFRQHQLSALGRIHSPADAVAAATYARDAGFDNFNLDLMFGLPQQSIDQAEDDLTQALALKPSHLSCYQLTIEPNTLFHHNPPITPDEEVLWDMQEALQAKLAEHYYQQYEVSAYAKTSQPGTSDKGNRQCQHNLNYWGFGDYLGIGAGAHGKITAEREVTRTWKIKHPTSYIDRKDKVGGRDPVKGKTLSFEFMLNALRLKGGFSLNDFEQRSRQSRKSIQPLIEKHQSLGLIEVQSDQVIPTEFGFNMLNNMLHDYLNDADNDSADNT